MNKLLEIERATAGPAAKGSDFLQRRKFLDLPLEKRREILKQQASTARAFYARSIEWRDWESADLTRSTR
jgi:hypothetical protein